jgi:hypothetical protein
VSQSMSNPASRSSLSIACLSSLWIAASVWLALPGCDETPMQRTGEAPLDGKQDAKQPATPQAVGGPAAAPREQAIAGYDQCYRECFNARTSETNRETCKLECDGLAEEGLGASSDLAAREVHRHLRGCLIDCWEDTKLSATNRETCLLTCTDDAAVAFTTPPEQTLEVVPGTVLAPDAQLPPGVRPTTAGTK